VLSVRLWTDCGNRQRHHGSASIVVATGRHRNSIKSANEYGCARRARVLSYA
jgi:hypothetical protein